MRNWDNYFIEMTEKVSERATCSRLKVGAILVKDKRIIATGYNGGTSGEDHCEDVGCKLRDNHCIRTIHAEQNAIIQCAKFGVATEGATLYITHFPCLHCTKTLIQAGIKEIVYLHDYNNDEYAKELLNKSYVRIYKLEEGEDGLRRRVKNTSWAGSILHKHMHLIEKKEQSTFSDENEVW